MLIAGHFYLYRVETFRDPENRVRQRVLEYLGALNPIYKHHTVSFVHRVHPVELVQPPDPAPGPTADRVPRPDPKESGHGPSK